MERAQPADPSAAAAAVHHPAAAAPAAPTGPGPGGTLQFWTQSCDASLLPGSAAPLPTQARFKVGHAPDIACCAALSSNGRWLATGSDGKAHVFTAGSGAHCHTFVQATQAEIYTRAVCFSAHETQLITGAEDGIIRMWNLRTAQLRHQFFGHTGEVSAVATTMAHDGRLFLSAGSDGDARCWNSSSGKCEWTLPVASAGLTSAACARSGALAVVGAADPMAMIIDLPTGVEIGRCSGHTDGVFGVSLAANDTTLATASLDCSVRIWDIRAPCGPFSAAACLTFHRDMVLSCVFLDDFVLATGSADKLVAFHDLRMMKTTQALHGHQQPVVSLATGGGQMVACTGTEDVYVFAAEER